MGYTETRIMDVSHWEFWRLHQEVRDLRRLGWRVDFAQPAGLDAGSLQLILRREAGLAWG